MMRKLILLLLLLLSAQSIWSLNVNGTLGVAPLNYDKVLDASTNDQFQSHEVGYWLVLQDRFGREVWQEMSDYDTYISDENFIIFTNIMLYYSEYGGYDPEITYCSFASYNIVIDGIKYGAEYPDCWALGGRDKEFPLIEGDNNFIVSVGYAYAIGVAEVEETNDKYLEVIPIMGYADETNPSDYITGDVDWNAKVNISDVTMLVNYVVNGSIPNIHTGNADVNGDGQINITDVTMLISYVLKGHW